MISKFSVSSGRPTQPTGRPDGPLWWSRRGEGCSETAYGASDHAHRPAGPCKAQRPAPTADHTRRRVRTRWPYQAGPPSHVPSHPWVQQQPAASLDGATVWNPAGALRGATVRARGGSGLRWRRAVSGGGERSLVEGSGLRCGEAVSGGGERSQAG